MSANAFQMKAKAVIERKKERKRKKEKVQNGYKRNRTHFIPDSLVESNLFPQSLRKPCYDTNGTGGNKVLKQNVEVLRRHCKNNMLIAKEKKSCDAPCKPGINASAKVWRHAKEYNENELDFDKAFKKIKEEELTRRAL